MSTDISATSMSSAVTILPNGWLLSRDRRGAPDAADRVVIQPGRGVVLVELGTHRRPEAVKKLRAFLKESGFTASHPGHLPILQRRLRHQDTADAAVLLDGLFEWQESITIANDGWETSLVALLAGPQEIPVEVETLVAVTAAEPAASPLVAGMQTSYSSAVGVVPVVVASPPQQRPSVVPPPAFAPPPPAAIGPPLRQITPTPSGIPRVFETRPSVLAPAPVPVAVVVPEPPAALPVEPTVQFVVPPAVVTIPMAAVAPAVVVLPPERSSGPNVASVMGAVAIVAIVVGGIVYSRSLDNGNSAVTAQITPSAERPSASVAAVPAQPTSETLVPPVIRPPVEASRLAPAPLPVPRDTVPPPAITPVVPVRPAAPSPPPPRVEVTPPAQAPSGVTPQAVPPPPSEAILALLRRGDALMANGDVSAARRFFERAANTGSPAAAWALAETFDHDVLVRRRIRPMMADASSALRWYREAARLGVEDASNIQRLEEMVRQGR